ncbi:nuclear factor of activated T-cell, cytoplasmic 2-like protein [Cricetulus griseus]|nr:nuclear factor of activated T-cell, cytoplasmic 2-like protein [Cricetulus griseus]
MQRPALRRPGPRQPLRTMGSADRGNCATALCIPARIPDIPVRIPAGILASHPRSSSAAPTAGPPAVPARR